MVEIRNIGVGLHEVSVVTAGEFAEEKERALVLPAWSVKPSTRISEMGDYDHLVGGVKKTMSASSL